MKAYQFKLYRHKRNRHLHSQIGLAAEIYNHCIALHKRYYRLFGKHLNVYALQRHLTRLKRRKRYQHWNQLGSQAIQDIAQRIDKAYKLFFSERKAGNKRIRPPSFRKRQKYKSFTLKQAGYRLLQDNYIRIGKRIYRYFKSRDIEGNIKTLTVKRDRVGDLYIIAVTDAQTQPKVVERTGKIVGFDFGLKTYLTASDGYDIQSPLFFKQHQKTVRKANQRLARKQRGGNNRRKAHRNLARVHRRVANLRRDFQWKLANRLTDAYDVLIFEDLNLKGMKALYGKKISDLGFYSFLQKVKYYAAIKDKTVHFIDRFYPSSKTCSNCGHVYQDLELREREWTCSAYGVHHDRDRNASLNILSVGASTLGLGDGRPQSVEAVGA